MVKLIQSIAPPILLHVMLKHGGTLHPMHTHRRFPATTQSFLGVKACLGSSTLREGLSRLMVALLLYGFVVV